MGCTHQARKIKHQKEVGAHEAELVFLPASCCLPHPTKIPQVIDPGRWLPCPTETVDDAASVPAQKTATSGADTATGKTADKPVVSGHTGASPHPNATGYPKGWL